MWQIIGVILKGCNSVEVRALVIADIGTVVAEEVPFFFRGQGQEPRIAESSSRRLVD